MRRAERKILLLMLIPCWGLSGCVRNDSKTPSPGILPRVVAHTFKVASEYTYSVTFYGRMQPRQESRLAFELPGKVDSILTDVGVKVKSGTVLARLNTDLLEAERKLIESRLAVESSLLDLLRKGERYEVIAAARADVLRLAAEAEQLRRKAARTADMREKETVTETEYEAVEFGYRAAKASLEAGKQRLRALEAGSRVEDIQAQQHRQAAVAAELAALELKLSKSVLHAPFDAEILLRQIDEGSVVGNGQPVLTVQETGAPEARFSLPVSWLVELDGARQIAVRNRVMSVAQHRVVSAVDDTSRTVDVIFDIPEYQPFFAGETCEIAMTRRVTAACVVLPLAALVPSVRGLWSCFRLEPAEQKQGDQDFYRVVKEELNVLHTDGNVVVIKTTLPDDSLVVVEGTQKIVPGMFVQVVDEVP